MGKSRESLKPYWCYDETAPRLTTWAFLRLSGNSAGEALLMAPYVWGQIRGLTFELVEAILVLQKVAR
jgi:hypothetical protein